MQFSLHYYYFFLIAQLYITLWTLSLLCALIFTMVMLYLSMYPGFCDQIHVPVYIHDNAMMHYSKNMIISWLFLPGVKTIACHFHIHDFCMVLQNNSDKTAVTILHTQKSMVIPWYFLLHLVSVKPIDYHVYVPW